MQNVLEILELSSPPLLAVLVDTALKGVVVLLLALLASLAWRRGPAASRHAIWSLASVSLLALPLLALVVPSWKVTYPAPWTAAPQPQPAAKPARPAGTLARLSPEQDPTAARVVPPEGSRSTEEIAPPTRSSPSAHLKAVVEPPPSLTWPLWLWSGGALMLALPVIVGLFVVGRLRRSARPLREGPMPALLHELTTQLGLRRPVTLLQSERRSMPMTWGLLRPVILLPVEAASWPAERLRVVLLHELAHIQRWDCLTQLLGYLARAVHWFNPLAWLALSRLKVEQERACDDTVLTAGSRATDYAEHLLTIALGRSSAWLPSPVALGMAQSDRIRRRLQSILDPNQSRRAPPRWQLAVATLAALVAILPLAALRLQAAPKPASETRAAEDDKPSPEAEAEAKKLAQVRTKVSQLYVKPVDEKELTGGAIKGLLEALHDPYSQYLSPEEQRDFDRSLATSFTGIGVQIRLLDKKLTVMTPLEDSPALQAGIRPGDVILAIDGKSTKDMDLQQAVKLILGPAGSELKLKVQHPGGEEVEVTLKRAALKVRTVKGYRRDRDDHWEYLLSADPPIGYLGITQFGPDTPQEVKSVLQKLADKKIKGLILDLRFSPGGLLQSAVDVAGMFIPRGTILTVKGRDNSVSTFKADGKSVLTDVPLVVLLNEHTASAAEILAGALKDNERALLVGARSFGKGSVQSLIPVPEGGVLKLTTAHYFLPSGRNIQKHPGDKNWGVDPADGYYVPLDAKQVEELIKKSTERELIGRKKEDFKEGPKITPKVLTDDYADPQLAAALETMLARIDTGAFKKVGKSNATLLAHLGKKEELEKQRADLQKKLDEVNKDLTDLERSIREHEK